MQQTEKGTLPINYFIRDLGIFIPADRVRDLYRGGNVQARIEVEVTPECSDPQQELQLSLRGELSLITTRIYSREVAEPYGRNLPQTAVAAASGLGTSVAIDNSIGSSAGVVADADEEEADVTAETIGSMDRSELLGFISATGLESDIEVDDTTTTGEIRVMIAEAYEIDPETLPDVGDESETAVEHADRLGDGDADALKASYGDRDTFLYVEQRTVLDDELGPVLVSCHEENGFLERVAGLNLIEDAKLQRLIAAIGSYNEHVRKFAELEQQTASPLAEPATPLPAALSSEEQEKFMQTVAAQAARERAILQATAQRLTNAFAEIGSIVITIPASLLETPASGVFDSFCTMFGVHPCSVADVTADLALSDKAVIVPV